MSLVGSCVLGREGSVRGKNIIKVPLDALWMAKILGFQSRYLTKYHEHNSINSPSPVGGGREMKMKKEMVTAVGFEPTPPKRLVP